VLLPETALLPIPTEIAAIMSDLRIVKEVVTAAG
jgi:hypothetical protein